MVVHLDPIFSQYKIYKGHGSEFKVTRKMRATAANGMATVAKSNLANLADS